jgi:hypothetical protein
MPVAAVVHTITSNAAPIYTTLTDAAAFTDALRR